MKSNSLFKSITLGGLIISLATTHAYAVNLIVNGGFETGNFNGWSTLGVGYSGPAEFIISDRSLDPPGPTGPLPPISGLFDVVNTQYSPGSSELWQTVTIPDTFSSIVLSWNDRIYNWADDFYVAYHQFWVQIYEPPEVYNGSFHNSRDRIHRVFSTEPGDRVRSRGPNPRSFDLTAPLRDYAGQDIDVVFTVASGEGYFNVMLDDISLDVQAVPDAASSVSLLSLGLLAIVGIRRRIR